MDINNGFIIVYGTIHLPQTGNTWTDVTPINHPISFAMEYPQDVCNNATLKDNRYPNCAHTSCTSTQEGCRVYNIAEQWLHYAAFGY